MSSKFDPDKDAANIAKHGLSLVEGEGVLNDPLGLTIEDDSSEGEPAGLRSERTPRVNYWLRFGPNATTASA